MIQNGGPSAVAKAMAGQKAHPTFRRKGWHPVWWIGGGNPGWRPGLNNNSDRYPVDFAEFAGKKRCLAGLNMI